MTDHLHEPPPRPEYPPGPRAGDLIGHVGVNRRRCADGSYTLYMRWRQWSDNGTGPKTYRVRLMRTGPSPTRRELRNAVAQARVKCQTAEEYLREGRAPLQRMVRYPLQHAIATHLDVLRARSSESTCYRRESRLLHFVKWHSAENPSVPSVGGVTPQHIRAYVDAIRTPGNRARPLKDATVRLALSDLSAMFAHAETRDWCRGNPADAVRGEMGRPHKSKKPVIILPDVHMRTIVAGCAEAAFLFATGLRVGSKEAGGALWTWLDLEHGLLIVPESECETTKIHGRTIPIGTGLLRLLTATRKAEGVIFPCMERVVRKRMRQFPYAHRSPTPHWARKWFSTRMKDAGCAEADILYVIGHTQPANMGPYYGFEAEKIRPFVQAVDDLVFG